MQNFAPFTISMLIAIVVSIVILAFAAVVLFKVFTNRIDLADVLAEGASSETHGKASLSRLQFLIFTFVIAGLYLVICIETGSFVEVPGSVLGLLGISGASYLVSKSIGKPSKPRADRDDDTAPPRRQS